MNPFSLWQSHDVLLAFEDATYSQINVPEYLKTAYQYASNKLGHEIKVGRVINGRCLDISKQFLGEQFEEVFGYPLLVAPTSYVGSLVRKSNSHSAHDGQILTGPLDVWHLEAEQEMGEFVYTVLVNNVTDNGYVQDIRLPIFDGIVPFVYIKERPLSNRFSNTNSVVYLQETDAGLSTNELCKVKQFLAAVGLDCGECDILRDRDTGKIYIVDVSRCPFGPPNHLVPEQWEEALLRLARAFDEAFFVHLDTRQQVKG